MTMSRRGLLGGLALGGAAGVLPRAAWGAMSPFPLGLQLYSVSAELDADFAGTLRQVAALGYREAETAGLHGRTPAAFAQAAAAAGLRLVSAHYSMPDLFADGPGRIAEAKALGVGWIVASSPRPDRPLAKGNWFTAMHDAMTLDAWQENAARLNQLGRQAQAAGLRFGYHNHPIEFALYDGRRGFDVLMAGTDPALVKLELDVAWAVAGGADPLALIRTHADRIRLLHLKGLKHKPAPGEYGTDFSTGVLGQGDVIDWRPVLAAARRAGVQHAFVEQEPPHVQPILQSLAACRDYLQHL